MQIRTAEQHDVPGLVNLWQEFMESHSRRDPDFVQSVGAKDRWAIYIGDKIADPDFQVLVADVNDVPAGYVVATIQKYPPIWTLSRFGFLQEIAVAEGHRRHGVARRLLLAAEDWLRRQGVKQIKVHIDVGNAASQALFRGEGFTPHTETLIKRY